VCESVSVCVLLLMTTCKHIQPLLGAQLVRIEAAAAADARSQPNIHILTKESKKAGPRVLRQAIAVNIN